MKTSRTRPSVRAGEERLISIYANDTLQFRSDQTQRLFPCHRNEAIAAPPFARTSRPVTQPAFANGGLHNARTVVYRVRNRANDIRWIRVAEKGLDAGDAPVDNDRSKDTPMRAVELGVRRGFMIRHERHPQ